VTDDYRIMHGGRTVGDDGGFVQWSFFDDDDVAIYVNLVNDIAIAASAVVDNSPTVTLVSPADASSDTDGWVTPNCTGTDDNQLDNMTHWNNLSAGTWAANWTNTTSGIWGQAYNNISISLGNTMLWGCRAVDNASQVGWNSANWTVMYYRLY
jgi:hypothetical protein